MGKINILDSSVFNRIAAGEVVERPCSIVKELVENSIDSGAEVISVEIRNGGLSFIRITDNGCGMDADDLDKAFMPHATSKIKNIGDLNEITTLGFRGEALTSIASVAKVTLMSRTSSDNMGNYIVVENGKVLEKGERGCPYGTSVIVEDLFKNVPARAKFLSKPSVEESVITDMIARLVMTNNLKSIKYSANDKTIYQSAGNGLKNAIYAIYGKTFIDNMEPIEYVMPDITIKGFINKPYFTKPNRTYQTLIANGRYVINTDISYCIYNCYKDYLMKRQFPVFILEIEVPPDMIDVNIHPNKLEVKFAAIDTIKRTLYKIIKNKLEDLSFIPKNITHGEDNIESISIKRFEPHNLIEAPQQENTPEINSLGNVFAFKSDFSDNVSIKSPKPSALGDEFMNQLSEISPHKGSDNNAFTAENYNESHTNAMEKPINDLFSQISDKEFAVESKIEYSIKTVLFDTYIVLEEKDSVLLVDQHAAHERILYDRLVREYENKSVSSQSMLIPHIFTVTAIEDELLKYRLDEINACGFSLSALSGHTYSLSAVPLLCAGLNVDYFINQILSELGNFKYHKVNFVKDILMQSACKAAIKGEDKLNKSEIDYLVCQYATRDKILMCPHGRPLIVRISKSEIEKWFKRTV